MLVAGGTDRPGRHGLRPKLRAGSSAAPLELKLQLLRPGTALVFDAGDGIGRHRTVSPATRMAKRSPRSRASASRRNLATNIRLE